MTDYRNVQYSYIHEWSPGESRFEKPPVYVDGNPTFILTEMLHDITRDCLRPFRRTFSSRTVEVGP